MPSVLDQTGLNSAAQAGGVNTSVDVYKLVSYGIRYLLGTLGIVFFVLLIIGGIQWMTSGGNEANIKAARQRIASAAVGLAVVLASYAITLLVLRIINSSTGGPWSGQAQPGDSGDYVLPPV